MPDPAHAEHVETVAREQTEQGFSAQGNVGITTGIYSPFHLIPSYNEIWSGKTKT